MSTDSVTERPVAVELQPGVPWGTVVPLAALMAYADGFWMVAERGAVGAIERTQEPFSSWLRESTLALPLFVLAVLGALTLSMRLFGPELRTAKEVLAGALLVVLAGTVVGIAVIVANTLYDYSLETDLLTMMNTMHGGCVGDCVALQQQSTAAALTRAVLYTGLFVLITNLVLVAWTVAVRGGRLAVDRVGKPSGDRAGGDRRPAAAGARLVLVATLIGSAVIHAAVIPEHLEEWTAAGVFFIALTVAQVVLAVLLLTSRDGVLLWAAVALNAGPLLLWMYSRTLGLPFGPEPGVPEIIGIADVVAGALEFVALTAAVILLRRNGTAGRRAGTAAGRSLIVVAVLAVTVIGVAGAFPGLVSGADASMSHPHSPDTDE